jgi:hypothetical protein
MENRGMVILVIFEDRPAWREQAMGGAYKSGGGKMGFLEGFPMMSHVRHW